MKFIHNLFKKKHIPPMGKTQFRRHILVSVLLQSFLVACILLGMQFMEFKFSEGKTMNFLFILAILQLSFVGTIFDFKKFQARYKDIFQGKELSLQFFIILCLTPLALWTFIAFLCLKDKSQRAPGGLLKSRYAFLAILPVLVIQFTAPRLAFWSASPSAYYVLQVLNSSSQIQALQEVSPRAGLIEHYQKVNGARLASTELVLLMAMVASSEMKERKRSIASGVSKDSANFEATLNILEASHKLISISEESGLNYFDYSPVQWLSPSGPFEIYLLSAVENEIRKNFAEMLMTKSFELIKGMEKKMTKADDVITSAQQERFKELRQKLSETKTYKKRS